MRTLYLLGDANASSVDFAQFWNTTDEVGGCFIFNLHAIESSDGNPTDFVGGIRVVFIRLLVRVGLKHPPTSSVGFRMVINYRSLTNSPYATFFCDCRWLLRMR